VIRTGTILLTLFTALSAFSADYSTCFIPGEITEYKITWMGIPIAWSRTTTEEIEEGARKLIRIRLEAKSYKAASGIYKVDDLTDIIIDPETALPVRIDIQIHEGSRKKSHLTTFHHDKKVAVFQDRISKDIREVPIAGDTQDIYSFIYANRNEPLQTLAEKTYPLYADGKVYNLGMKIIKESKVSLPDYGKVECTIVEPIAEFDGMFIRQGKILFWVSKENRRMVTCIKAKVPVGTVTAKLEKVAGPGDDFWVRRDKQ
jgi:hypothetical protein